MPSLKSFLKGTASVIAKPFIIIAKAIKDLFDDPEDIENFKKFARGVTGLLATSAGLLALEVVKEVNSLKPSITSSEAREMSIARLREKFNSAGKQVRSSFIALLVETAYNSIVGNIFPSDQDSDGDGIRDIDDPAPFDASIPPFQPPVNDGAGDGDGEDEGDTIAAAVSDPVQP